MTSPLRAEHMDRDTLISVVVPIYNGLPFIIETIESVRAQSYQKWELLLCDNASTDGTINSIRKALQERPDARVKMIEHGVHLPMAQSWNRALSHATGKFIKLLPSDDILLPRCLEVQNRLLEENPEAGFTTSPKEIIDANGKKLFARRPLKPGIYRWRELGPKTLYAVTNLLGEPAAILFREENLARCGDYDERFRYFIDLDLLLRFLQHGAVVVADCCLYQFRIHGSSASASSRRVAAIEYHQLLAKYETELGLADRPLLRFYLRFKAVLIPWLRAFCFRVFRTSKPGTLR